MYTFQLMMTSEKYKCVSFHIEGLVAVKRDITGEHFEAFKSYDEAVRWILQEVKYMVTSAPDLQFIA